MSDDLFQFIVGVACGIFIVALGEALYAAWKFNRTEKSK